MTKHTHEHTQQRERTQKSTDPYLSPLARHVVFEGLSRAFHDVVFGRQRCPPLQKQVDDSNVPRAAGAMKRCALPLVSCIDNSTNGQGRRVGGVEVWAWGGGSGYS